MIFETKAEAPGTFSNHASNVLEQKSIHKYKAQAHFELEMRNEAMTMIEKKAKSLLLCITLSLLILSVLNAYNSPFAPLSAAKAESSGWFYNGWQYRKEHNITQKQVAGALRFYDLSDPWTTISGNPAARHAFQPVHNTAMVGVNEVVDGETRKYLAYDSDPVGSEIRLYYTNDTAGVWTRYSGNPILGPRPNHYRWPSTAYVNGTFHMFLTDRTDGNLERWTSTDGIHYTLNENVKTGGNEYKNPYIWYNPNDNKWYLYSHDAFGTTEYFEVRNAAGIEDLDVASDTIAVSKTIPFGSPTVMFYGGKYWLLGEVLESGTWKVAAYSSTTSPSSGFEECFNSPILGDDECCPTLLLNPDQTHAYLFTGKDSSAWFEETREVYLNSTIISEAPDLANYQIKIKAFYGNGSDNGENVYLNGHSKADFGDIRFSWLNSSSQSELSCSYWIEELRPNDSAVFWVKIPEIPSKVNTTIYIYYSEDDALTTSNGDATFDFFDDFNETLSKWIVIGGTWKTENGELSGETNAFGQRIRANNFNFGNQSVHVKSKWMSGTYFEHGPYVKGQSPNEPNNGYITILSTWAYDSRHRISKMSGSSETTLAGQGTTSPSKNVWYGFTFGLYQNLLKSSVSPIYPTEISGTDSSFANGTLCLFSWSGASEHVHYDDLFVTKYVSPEPNHGWWGSEETGQYVLIDQTFVGDARANTGTVQTVGFHAKWNDNGSNIAAGTIYINCTEHSTDNAGWATFNASSATVGNDKWIVTGVNCSGATSFMQTAQTPSITWDQIKIVSGRLTEESLTLGETTTMWCKASYEYDGAVFDATKGVLYVNESAMTWSTTNDRWEYNYSPNTTGTVELKISGVLDNLYNLTVISDAIGTQIVTTVSTPFSVISNSTVSELVFNSTNKTLEFTVSGSSGTTGFTNVTIAKTLINDTNELTVYLDGTPINYTITSAEYSWIIHFNYNHSTHKVVLALASTSLELPLASEPAGTRWMLFIIAGGIAIASAIALLSIAKRKPISSTRLMRRKI